METLKYNITTKSYDFDSVVEYQAQPPVFLMDLIKGAYDNHMDLPEYFSSKNIEPESKISVIINKAFRGFPEFIDGSISESGIKKCIENGYVTKTKNITGKILSLAPLVNLFDVVIGKESFKLDDENQIEVELINIAKKITPNGAKFKVHRFIKDDDIQEVEKTINLEAVNGSLAYKNLPINNESVDFSELAKLNGIVIDSNNQVEFIPKEFQWLKHSDVSIKWNEVKTKRHISYLIKDRNIECAEFKSWNNMAMINKFVIREKEFKFNSEIYNEMLHAFIKEKEEGKIMQLNSFMFLEFLRNNDEVLESSLENLIKKYVNNKDALRAILFLEKDITIPSSTNTKFLEEIIVKATVANVPLALSKISEKQRDEMLSPKLLNRLYSLDKNLLSPKQRKIIEDEELKQNVLDDEFKLILGELASSGIREKFKKLKKNTKKLYKLDKSFKVFLDEYIGHNKGNIIVTSGLVQQAQNVLKKTNKVINYLENNN